MTVLKEERFDEFMAGRTALVKLFASWCAPCKIIAPILKDVSEETGIELIEVDTDLRADIAAVLGVSSVPSVIAYKNGQPIGGLTGSHKYEKYLALANQALAPTA